MYNRAIAYIRISSTTLLSGTLLIALSRFLNFKGNKSIKAACFILQLPQSFHVVYPVPKLLNVAV